MTYCPRTFQQKFTFSRRKALGMILRVHAWWQDVNVLRRGVAHLCLPIKHFPGLQGKHEPLARGGQSDTAIMAVAGWALHPPAIEEGHIDMQQHYMLGVLKAIS